MRCAEKAPMDILPAIEVDLHAFVELFKSMILTLSPRPTVLMILLDLKL